METYVIYHVIHVNTPYRYIPKMFITDVPDDKEVGWDLADEIEFWGEFGIPHANYYLEPLTPESPAEIKRAWRNNSEIRRIEYSKLVELENTL